MADLGVISYSVGMGTTLYLGVPRLITARSILLMTVSMVKVGMILYSVVLVTTFCLEGLATILLQVLAAITGLRGVLELIP
jgi:hypothetical protein